MAAVTLKHGTASHCKESVYWISACIVYQEVNMIWTYLQSVILQGSIHVSFQDVKEHFTESPCDVVVKVLDVGPGFKTLPGRSWTIDPHNKHHRVIVKINWGEEPCMTHDLLVEKMGCNTAVTSSPRKQFQLCPFTSYNCFIFLWKVDTRSYLVSMDVAWMPQFS